MFRYLWWRIKEFFLDLSVDKREEEDINWEELDSDWNVIPDAIEIDKPKKAKKSSKKRKTPKRRKKAAKHK